MKVATLKRCRNWIERLLRSIESPNCPHGKCRRGAVEAISNAFPDLPKKKVAIIAGKGNNGEMGL